MRYEKVRGRTLKPRRRCPGVFDVAVSAAQNRRDHMEDFAHVERDFLGRSDGLYVGVFDGHGGAGVARLAAGALHRVLATEMAAHPPEAALPRAFRSFDASVAAEPSGAVAVVAVIQGPSLTVANAGDSHAILVSPSRTELLTVDHRLANEGEFRRVAAAGARIRGPYACLPDGGGLMCTRSLGDRAYRDIGIVPDPDVRTRALAADDEWIISATDGVWDGLEPEAVGRIALAAGTAVRAAAAIRDAAVEASRDNVTVVAVRRQPY